MNITNIKESKYINMFKTKLISLLPYFVLAVAIIIVYNTIGEIRYIFGFIGSFFGAVWRILTPFVYGFVIAYIMHMPFEAMQRLIGKCKWKFIAKRKKSISLVFILILFVLMLFTISYLIVPAIYNSILLFIDNFEAYHDQALEWLEYLNDWELFGFNMNDAVGDISVEGIVEMVQEWLQDFTFEHFASRINDALAAVFGVGTAIFTGFLAFISSIYFLVEKDRIKYFLCRVLVAFTPIKAHDFTIKYGGKLDNNFKQYIKTQTIDGMILGTLATIALLIMGSPFALVLGIMLGIVNYIPYFGSIFGTLVAVVIVAFTQGITMGLIATAVLLIIQQIDANIIQPKLMGESFKLSPLLVIISITVGGATAGIIGMIMAIPIVKLLTDIFEDVMVHHEEHKRAKAADEDYDIRIAPKSKKKKLSEIIKEDFKEDINEKR